MKKEKEIRKAMLKLYKTPFRYDHQGQMVFDAHDEHVLDVRGWGRIQYMRQTTSEATALQDAFGEFVTKLLNDHYGTDSKAST